ncbi:MAG: hypothetical protein JWN67_3323 [Actinomycetia bacterium]|nr:hypothetical protein [Actinomycetes bacterium]
MAAAVEELVGMVPAALANGESIVALRRQIDQLEAVANRAIGAWDAHKEWAPSGAKDWCGVAGVEVPPANR